MTATAMTIFSELRSFNKRVQVLKRSNDMNMNQRVLRWMSRTAIRSNLIYDRYANLRREKRLKYSINRECVDFYTSLLKRNIPILVARKFSFLLQ
jgi:hypothetical protein